MYEVQHADNSEFESSQRLLKLEIDDNKKGLEQITKQCNAVSSGNVKKRHDINALRKDRTLYDHIFKTLEYQILGQEKKLYELIECNTKKDATIKESEDSLQSIKDLVSKNKYEDFYKIIEDEKKKYMEELEFLKSEAKDGNNNVYKSHIATLTAKHNNKTLGEINRTIDKFATHEDADACEPIDKLKFYEELFAEFRLQTCDEKQELVQTYAERGEELNEALYREFVDMENECEELKREYDALMKADAERNESTVSTVASQMQANSIDEQDAAQTTDTVNQLVAIFNNVAKFTRYEDVIRVNVVGDFNANFDMINEKASDIENWVNNLALLNARVEGEGEVFSKQVDVSMFSDEVDEDTPKDPRIDKQILNISQIANSSKLSSVQEGQQHAEG